MVKKNVFTRTSKAMELIGMKKTTKQKDLSGVTLKNFWRAVDYLRGKTTALNLISTKTKCKNKKPNTSLSQCVMTKLGYNSSETSSMLTGDDKKNFTRLRDYLNGKAKTFNPIFTEHLCNYCTEMITHRA